MTLRIMTEPQLGSSYAQQLQLAQLSERLGFGAFFRSDHYLKFGDSSGLPSTTDAWVTLAGLARDTSTIRLGTMVTPVTFRPLGTLPVLVAQVDHMSGGRVEVGLGAGWYEAEHAAYGLPFPPIGGRFDLLEDQLAILDGVWAAPAGETFRYSGRTITVEIEADTVRPHQRPRPALVLGGNAGPRAARLTARYGDEYNKAFVEPATIVATHDKIRRACEAIGRDPAAMVYSTSLTLCCGTNEVEIARRAATLGRTVEDLRAVGAAGSPNEVLDRLGELSDGGVDRFYLQVLDLDDLDQIHLIAEEVLPHAPGR